MNKKIIVITILSIITGLVIFNVVVNKEENIANKTNNQMKNENMFSMMLETEAGTGSYEEVTQSEWPQEGYVFNESLSKCENGGTLSWDDINKKVIMNSNVSDKCYVYFDKEPEIVYLSEYIKENVYTEDGTNGLYYHDGIGTYTNASEEAGDNSYRYSGANPNNYVCFGSDAAACPDDNLYRIIGLFDDDQDGDYQIKLIRNDSIGEYTWDITDDNDWTEADLNNSLNNELYWNTLSSEWQNMVASTTWHLGGMGGRDYTVKEFYNGERNNAGYEDNPTTYTDEIGLMYPSDYGYAASPENWRTVLYDYDNTTNTNNNWMYMGLNEWTITPESRRWDRVFHVSGAVSYVYTNGASSVRPSLYLKSNVGISDGTGTSSDPYRLSF